MRIKYVILPLLLILVFGATGIFVYLQRSLDQLVDTPISNIDLMEVQDGTYTGSYGKLPVDAKVKVTVTNHKITEIQLLEHVNGKGAQAEAIPEQVMKAQSLEVDVVSGATYSSKVILKAIENALTCGT